MKFASKEKGGFPILRKFIGPCGKNTHVKLYKQAHVEKKHVELKE